MLIFHIDGEPVPRHEIISGRRLIDARKAEKGRIKCELRRQYNGELLATAIKVKFFFHLAIPSSAPRKKKEAMLKGLVRPTKPPDCSNLQKLYEDCLIGTVIEDDRFVVSISSVKSWSLYGYTLIQIATIEETNVI